MRWVLTLWFLPMALFWGWYVASAYDVGGLLMFTREFHDHMFGIYGRLLGVDPAVIPGWFAKGCLIDSVLVLGIFALARRKAIGAWWRQRQEVSDTSLSSAP